MEGQEQNYYRVCAVVDLAAIKQNVRELKKIVPEGVRFCGVIKAAGYGHGAQRIALAIQDMTDMLAVATAEEAKELREAGISTPILILGYVHPSYYGILAEQEIRPTIFRMEDAKNFSEAAVKVGKTALCHIAIDTGMNRIGYPVTAVSADEIAKIAALPNLKIEGMFTHFARSDEEDRSHTEKQYAAFRNMKEMLEERGVHVPVCHCCNSAGILAYPDYAMDMVRAGIVLYGLYPSQEMKQYPVPLRSAITLKSHIVLIKEVAAGAPISYGGTYVTSETRKIATVPVGYGDGYPRLLSNRGSVLIHGQRAPIVGRVCMDQMMVDVTDIPDVEEGDRVILMGRDGKDEITAEELADLCGTISYEIICTLGARIPRQYRDGEKRF